jgi:hypothetical protein
MQDFIIGWGQGLDFHPDALRTLGQMAGFSTWIMVGIAALIFLWALGAVSWQGFEHFRRWLL